MDASTKTYEPDETAEVIWENDVTRVVLRKFSKPRPKRVAPIVRHGGYEVWYIKPRPDRGPDDFEWVLLDEELPDEARAIEFAEAFWPW